MSCGNDFVAMVKKIGYPKADELKGNDFDWLVESSESRSFLEWFCGNVNEQYVVSERELQEFDSLREFGKPILEGNALDDVLKTLKPVDTKNCSEEEELKKLEDELQTIQKLKKLQIHRHSKLQMMIIANSRLLQTLKSRENEAHKELKKGLEMFTAATHEVDNELLSFVDSAKQWASFCTASGSEQGSDPQPVFFSQLSLDKYLAQEEENSASLSLYINKSFDQSVSKWVENSHEGSFQFANTSRPDTCEETNEISEETQEVTRFQTAYICAQLHLIQMQAEEESLNSAIKCVQSMLQSLNSRDTGKQENLTAKIPCLNDEISTIREDTTWIKNEELLPLLKEKALLLSMPVEKCNLEHQIAQQEYCASRQDKIFRLLISQKASFELNQLACEVEFRKNKEVSCQLEKLVESLKQRSDELQQSLQEITEQIKRAQPRNIISSEDGFSFRLYKLLEGENKNQELFKTYKGLEQMAQKLKQDCAKAQDQLAASSQEQSFLLSKLESDVHTLHDELYHGGDQIQLSNQELVEQLQQLETDLNKLNELLTDLMADVKSKRSFLESDKLGQMARNLYVYFYTDEDRLKEMVEKLEQQAEVKASALADEDFATSGVLGLILEMERCTSYIGCDISKVPLSDTAQRIMSALQSIPVEVQTSRKKNRSLETTKDNKLGDKDAQLENEKFCKLFEEIHGEPVDSVCLNFQSSHYGHLQNSLVNEALLKNALNIELKELHESTITILKTSASPEINKSGQIVRTLHTSKMLCYQDTKRDSCYQDVNLPTWGYHKTNPEVKAKNQECEKSVTAPLKRKQVVPLSCSEKTRRLPVRTYASSHERYDCTSGQSESSENCPFDVKNLGCEEKRKLLTTIKQAAAFVTTMIFQDGSSQLNSEQVLTSSVKGFVVLVKRQTSQPCPPSYSSTDCTWNVANENDKLIYLRLEWPSLWEQAQQAHERFAWQVLFQMLRCKVPIICFNAKDFLRTLLQVYGNEISWKQVADSVVLDPRIAAWLINPSDTVPSFECLIQKYFEKPCSMGTVNTDTSTLRNASYQNLGVNLQKLYNVMMDLVHDLQVQGLWQLFCTLELPLLKILAVMETHKILVNKHELKKTSEILGLRLKELEQEAHQVAGEQFLVTSSSQLREVLFEKLKLHTLCEKVHRTEIQQLVSTSEVVLKQLQDLHPLPKIILEYRQVHKMKSTYVDGLQTCMRKGFISSTWNQTGTATGRLSAKHPNIQGISKHPVRITKKLCIKGKEEEIITFSPRTLFVSKKGYTFLAADFSHIELRILADLSSEPELLKLFQVPETTDIFSRLASQWKGIPSDQVQHADREQAKRIVYSVVYGAGKERLADCLGITPLQASQFIESFMQKYKKIHEFTKRTIEQCRNKGYVVSIMGRKRPLANINAQDYKLRTQAERQAVNFVVQGSAADLCKMAMVEIFTSVVISSTLTARLIAQIHDELLFEVEDSQIHEFSALVKRTMESLQQTTALKVPLKVPLKVILTTGKSWGCMTELQEM